MILNLLALLHLRGCGTLTQDPAMARISVRSPELRGFRPVIEGACVDPLRLCIALSPLAAYVLLLGLINLSSRSLVTSGGRDLAALALGISGLVIVGPMELFFPEVAVERFGGYVWLMLLGLYGLLAVLLMLILRPRLVIYNMTVEQLQAGYNRFTKDYYRMMEIV